MCLLDLGGRPPRNRIFPGHDVEQEHAEAIDVGARRGWRSCEQLWSHIDRRAGQAAARHGRLQLLTGTEVHQDQSPAVFAHDVLRLDVAMNQSGAMHGGDRAAQLRQDRRRFAGAEGALLPDEILERAPLDQLHPYADAAVDAIGAVDRDHMRVAHASQEASFIHYLGDGTVRRMLAMQDFERDLAR